MVDGCKVDESIEVSKSEGNNININENVDNNYYSPTEVSKIHNISRQAVIDRCKAGKYQGAIKTQPDRMNKQGLWLIPKQTIDNPDTEFVPAPIPTQADLATLKNDFRGIMAEEYTKHLANIQQLHEEQIAFMQQKFESQNQESSEKIQQLEEKLSIQIAKNSDENKELVINGINENRKKLQEIEIQISRVERHKKSWWSAFWSD